MTTPFVAPSVNANTRFVPTRIGGEPGASSTSGGMLKPPKAPDKPLVPYMRFSRQMWHKVRDENPECQLWDIGKKIGALWRELALCEKQIFQEQWEVEKVEYDRQMKAYHNSAAYQAYAASKNPSSSRGSGMSSREREQLRLESGIFIQPVDEDDGEYHASVRRLAQYRFEKNHKLISDLFNSANVADTRSVVTQQRITMLRRQASSLTSHQKNLENELCELDNSFAKKRKQIEDASENFGEQLKKVCSKKPVVDDDAYEQMIQQASEKLLQAYQNYKDKQQADTDTANVTNGPSGTVTTVLRASGKLYHKRTHNLVSEQDELKAEEPITTEENGASPTAATAATKRENPEEKASSPEHQSTLNGHATPPVSNEAEKIIESTTESQNTSPAVEEPKAEDSNGPQGTEESMDSAEKK